MAATAMETLRREASKDFATFDEDKSGWLDYAEFCSLVLQREGELPDDELLRRFQELDADNSGTVDAEEYICSSLIEGLTHARVNLLALLERFDTDHSGKIDRREFRSSVHELGFRAEVKFIDKVFDSLDEDGSGQLDYKELATALRPSTIARNKHRIRRDSSRKSKTGSLSLVKLDAASGESIQEQLRTILNTNRVRVIDMFHDWDTNDDGFVTAVEFREAVRALGFQAERKDIDALFAFFDKDGSGKLDFKELHRALRAKAPQLRRLPSATSPTRDAPRAAQPRADASSSPALSPLRAPCSALPSRPPGSPSLELAGGPGRLEAWAASLEVGEEASALKGRLEHAEAEVRVRATREHAMSAVGEQLLAQVHELQAALAAANAERHAGVKQLASLARSLAVAEKKLSERDATVAERDATIAALHARPLAVELAAISEEKTLLEAEVEILSQRLYASGAAVNGLASPSGFPPPNLKVDGEEARPPESAAISPETASARAKAATDRWIARTRGAIAHRTKAA